MGQALRLGRGSPDAAPPRRDALPFAVSPSVPRRSLGGWTQRLILSLCCLVLALGLATHIYGPAMLAFRAAAYHHAYQRGLYLKPSHIEQLVNGRSAPLVGSGGERGPGPVALTPEAKQARALWLEVERALYIAEADDVIDPGAVRATSDDSGSLPAFPPSGPRGQPLPLGPPPPNPRPIP